MEDKYIMMDVLLNEKYLVHNTSTALNEASSDHVYKIYLDTFKKLSEAAKSVFTLCYNNDWYQLEEAPKTKISKEHDKLSTELG
ncbi:MAG: spore coat protein [Bacilli bacterium]|nr:spore coat protein [Bacilli bacterium]